MANSNRRLLEILTILKKYHLNQGLTPLKLKNIFMELGPTFVKIGQIMSLRNDLLPNEYCQALESLHADVKKMDFAEVVEVVESSTKQKLTSMYADFKQQPLGSASIAQVHLAHTLENQEVVVKVQRKGIYEKMQSDVSLLKKAIKILKLTPNKLTTVIDFNMVLDELWDVAKQEMDFYIEAKNCQEFYENNHQYNYILSPQIISTLSTDKVLVMNNIGGIRIDEKEQLLKAGYNCDEIAEKLINNYIKQVVVDGFFHADPHPGNIHICNGKIAWLDLGMMGRLSHKDQNAIMLAMAGVVEGDISKIKVALLTLGDVKKEINHHQLYNDIDSLLARFGSLPLKAINLASIMEEILNIAEKYHISLPKGVALLARGISTIEGVIIDLNPNISSIELVTNYLTQNAFSQFDLSQELKASSITMYDSSKKLLKLPAMVSELLKMTLKGETNVNITVNNSAELRLILNFLVNKMVLGIIAAAMLISFAILQFNNSNRFQTVIAYLLLLMALSILGMILYSSFKKKPPYR